MQLTGLIDVLRQTEAYRHLMDHLRSEDAHDSLPLGVIRAARPFVIGTLATDWNGPLIYITARPDHAYNTAEQLPVWMDEGRVTRFNEPSAMFYERAAWGETAISGRLAALAALMQEEAIHPVVVTSARALMQRTLPANTFRRATITIQEMGQYDIQALLQRLQGIGYRSVTQVVEPGTFSRRGGIVDIYPVTADQPVRIEFFDDEVDSLRQFDPASQRSTGSIAEVQVTPAREALPELTPPLAETLQNWFSTLQENGDDAASPLNDAGLLSTGGIFPHLEHYLPYLYPHPVSLLDYATDDTLIIVEDWDALRDTVENLEDDAENTRAEKFAVNELAPNYPRPYLSWPDIEKTLKAHRTLRLDSSAHLDVDVEKAIGAGPMLFGGLFVPAERFGGQLKNMLKRVRRLRDEQSQIVVVTEQAHRLTDLWSEQEGAFLPIVDQLSKPPQPGSPVFLHGVLREGFSLRNHTHLYTDAEIFGWRRAEPRRRRAAKRVRVPEAQYADWREGDYVVHEDYGIGQFAGMRRRTIDGTEREYLLVNFEANAKLFVPIHQADRLTRYVGPDDRPPQLTRLGGPDWSRTKSKARKNVEEEARDLLELYASRARSNGFAFGQDTPWQKELEASFPYIETEDQLRAVGEVKQDMESPHPMDRLICGDAGYGKTEVAVRAAFKAIQDGKQVAVLVPTTVLAQQHFETFQERMEAFPVQVEQLSRFRSREEQNKSVDRLASGEVDVIVGTHRILSKDIRFKDLGLVIVDEEQRFGVKQKEHFKRLRTEVDILTLTATPIPRTMQMALTGVRDISMIQTPPEERLPVITHVGAYDDRLARTAIIRELERDGQVFFIHNRVRTIQTVRAHLEALIPEARIITAHGQLDGRTLGSIMRAFARGEYDILLSTSIIESGIDIPTANTLIVDRADWFGLSQLYQIRGRVGRSAQQAYAYFFHPPHSKLTNEALARLDTLGENTQLGAGFQIALRDLEIRGAGDLLSTQQSGHVAAVGLFLYTQMLAQAVNTLKESGEYETQKQEEPGSVTIDLPTPAYLPTDWIPEIALRLQIYRRIAALDALEDVQMMRDELADRFGPLPPAVQGLLYQIDVKVMAREAGASAVLHRKEQVQIKLPYLPNIDRKALAAELGEKVTVTRTEVAFPLYLEDMGTWQVELLDVLEKLKRGTRTSAMEGL